MNLCGGWGSRGIAWHVICVFTKAGLDISLGFRGDPWVSDAIRSDLDRGVPRQSMGSVGLNRGDPWGSEAICSEAIRMDLDDDRRAIWSGSDLKRSAELALEDLESLDSHERDRILKLTATLNFEYPEDVPEMASMSTAGARIFSASRDEVLSEWAWDLAAGMDISKADLATAIQSRWLRSDLRHYWARARQEEARRSVTIRGDQR